LTIELVIRDFVAEVFDSDVIGVKSSVMLEGMVNTLERCLDGFAETELVEELLVGIWKVLDWFLFEAPRFGSWGRRTFQRLKCELFKGSFIRFAVTVKGVRKCRIRIQKRMRTKFLGNCRGSRTW
jgi:hypothetical protein